MRKQNDNISAVKNINNMADKTQNDHTGVAISIGASDRARTTIDVPIKVLIIRRLTHMSN